MGFEKEDDFPLTELRTPRSSTGVRKPCDGVYSDYSQQDLFNSNEKHGWSNNRQTKKPDAKSALSETYGELIELNRLGRIYTKITQLSNITRYLIFILPIALLIATPIVIYAIFKPNEIFTSTGVRVYLFWVWIEVVWLSFWASKLVSKAVPHLFVTLCGVINAGTRKYAAILHAVNLQLNLVIWVTISFITFTELMSPGLNDQKYQKHWIVVVKNLLGASLISSLLYLAEKMLIQLISITYHCRSFEDRIKENNRRIYSLSLLYEASRSLYPIKCQEFQEEDEIINSSFKIKLSKIKNIRHGPSTSLRFMKGIGKIGDIVSTAFGSFASEIIGKQVYSRNSAQNIVSEALRKVRTSEALARRLWMSFVVEEHNSLYASDIREVFGPTRQNEADECFAILDSDINGDVSLDEMIIRVVEVGRDRKAISASMQDVGQAIGVLDDVLGTIMIVIIIFIFVAFQNASFLSTLATAGTALLSLSFVFAVTAQEFLGSCIFLFVKHPYDVGDHCHINSTALKVEQISLLFTIFKRISNLKMVQIPNSVLNTLWIENITRSKAMKEQIELSISYDTPLEDIEILRTTIEAFVEQPDNSRDFLPNVLIEMIDVNPTDKLSIRVQVLHKSNWHNENVRVARHNKLMSALITALHKIPIYGPGGHKYPLGVPANPTYTVSVTNDWATDTRKNTDIEREGKRLANSLSKGEEKMTEETPKNPNSDFRAFEEQFGCRSSEEKADATQSCNEIKSSLDGILYHNYQRQVLLKRSPICGRRRPGEAIQEISPNIISQNSAPLATSNKVRSQNLGEKFSDEENQIGMSRSSEK